MATAQFFRRIILFSRGEGVETAGLATEEQKFEDGILISFGMGIGDNNLYLYSFLYL